MGRKKIIRDYPLVQKNVNWKDGRQKDEIETILSQLSEYMPPECKGVTSRGILWAVRQLHVCIEIMDSDQMELAILKMAAKYPPSIGVDPELEEFLQQEQMNYIKFSKRL